MASYDFRVYVFYAYIYLIIEGIWKADGKCKPTNYYFPQIEEKDLSAMLIKSNIQSI